MTGKGPTALVTGATGLLGYHITQRLHELGWRVHALVRNRAAARWLEKQGVELFEGDVRDASTVAAAAGSADIIFHCAASIAASGGWDAYRRTNVEGTLNVIGAARASGARLVHASSVAVYGAEARSPGGGEKVTEETEFAALLPGEHYGRSKRESELLVLDAHRRGEIWACALRPDVIYGVRDRQFVPRVARLLRLPVVPIVGGGCSILPIVHAGNVADAAILAAQSDGAGGQVYNVANDFDVKYRDFLELGARGLNRSPHMVNVPLAVAKGLAGVVERAAAAGLLGNVPVPQRNSLAFITVDNPFSSERARKELGWLPRHRPEDTIPAAFQWERGSRLSPG